MAELKIKFHYEHGIADTGRLDLYDASVALNGIARAISIVTHAFINGEVRTHGDAAQGAKFYINTPKRGSFTYEASIWVAGAISGGMLYDFVKYAFNEAVGKINQSNNYSASLTKRIEPIIDELTAVLESPLSDIHRPIRKEPVITLEVTRPRGEVLALFDSETALYLLPQTIPAPHEIVGNVTKYNNLTGWGRFFDRLEGRTISFNISLKSPERQKELITWSQHENNMGREGLLYFTLPQMLLSPQPKRSSVILLKKSVICQSSNPTTGSNRSLRSLGRAKARPLTKRYEHLFNHERFQ